MNGAIAWRLLWCMLGGLLMAGPLQAVDEYSATPGRTALSFALLRDAVGSLTVDEVADPARAGDFVPFRADTHNMGYTADVLWLRVSLANLKPSAQRYYLDIGPPRLRDVRFFEPRPDGGWREYATGLEVPVQQREVASRQPLLRTTLQPHETRTVYARIASGNAISLEADQWSPLAFVAWENRLDQVNLFQFGALAMFAVFALLLAAIVRDRIFLLFGLGMFTQCLYEASILQYGHQWLWPNAPEWSLRSPGVFVTVAIAAVGALTVELLRSLRGRSRVDRLIEVQALLALLVLPVVAWGPYPPAVAVVNLLALTLSLSAAVVCVAAFLRGNRLALPLIAAFGLFWLVAIVRSLQIMGVLSREFLSYDYSWAGAAVISGLLMTVMLAQHVRTIRRAQERLQQQALRSAVDAQAQLEAEVSLRTRELEAARRRAEEASAAKSQFLAQLGHEFRTPLHGVLGYAALMAEEKRSVPDQRRLAAIRRSGNHLLTLIDELLEFSRLEAGRAALYVHPVNLPAFLQAVIDEVQPLAGDNGILLGMDTPPDLPEGVLLDETRLRQVLLNLLANACRHSGGRHVTLRVRVESRAGDTVGLYLGVRDDGIGLSDDDQRHLFDLFWQRPGSDPGGLGLGLPIARQWVRHMGGELVVVSAEGAGSLFQFTLMLPRAPAPSAPAGQWLRTGAHEALPSARPRVLAVDDQEINRELMADMLRAAGCEPLAVASGQAALDLLAREDVAFVLVDQMMPGMDGWAFLQRARESGIDQPFVLVSAATPAPPPGWSGEYRFADFVGKPVHLSQLRDLVARLTGSKLVAGPGPVDLPHRPVGQVRPSAAALERLHRAATLGLVSDIDDWVRQTRDEEPAAAGFVARVEAALARIDLAAIERLAAAG